MARTAGARNDPARAARVLSERAFRQGIKLTAGQIDTLDDMALGRFKPRNAVAVLGAIRTKMEYAYAKPKQETELSGSVTIVVQSPLVGAPGSRSQAKAFPVANVGTMAAIETAEGQANQVQRPITAIMSTTETAESRAIPQASSADIDPILAPSVMEADRLAGAPDNRSAEQRREDARIEWQADQAKLRGGRP